MARLLTLILIAANVLYFAWAHWVDGNRAELTAVPVTARAPKPAAPPPPPPCATLGPFDDEALAEQAQRALEGGGWGSPATQSSREQVNDGYWVHIDNLTSTVQQVRTVNAIRRAGIADAFAMPEDPQFRVSVGIFTEEARAEDRAARVQRLKLDAIVTERMKDQSIFWLDVPGVAPQTMSDGRLATLGVVTPGLRIETCP